MTIGEALAPEEFGLVRALLVEYAQGLDVDLSFQGFDEELATLPGAYAPPRGRLLLAVCDGDPAGCVGLRPLGAEVCEMKRLYVRPARRGSGLGRLLVRAIMEAGAQLGYERMRLDTLPQMGPAIRLYRSFGFEPIEPYTANLDGAMFFETTLVP